MVFGKRNKYKYYVVYSYLGGMGSACIERSKKIKTFHDIREVGSQIETLEENKNVISNVFLVNYKRVK